MALTAAIDLTVKKPDFKSMKSEIKELTIQAQQAVMEFGEFSPEAIKAEKALAQARDRMEDFNDRVKAVNPDKFAQINTVVQGVARGFQAAQGAMALFGSESEDLQKTMVKLQGAMALAEGLEGLGKVQQQFGAIAKNIKGGVMSAFKALGNMSTLAFGAIGIALTLIIANFETLKKAVMSLIPGLGSMVKFVGGLVQQFTDWVGITSAQDRALAKLNKTTERANDQLDREIALLKARGDELGVFNKQREKLQNDLALARANIGKNNEKAWGKIIDDTKNALEVLEIEEQNYIKDQTKAQNDANTEAGKKRKAEKDKQIADELKRQEELEAIRVKAQDQIISAELSANDAARALRLAQTTDEGEKLQVEYENQLAALQEAHIQEQIANAGNAEALALIDQKYANLQLLATDDLNKKELDLQKKLVDEQKAIDDKQLEEEKKRNDERIKQAEIVANAKMSIEKSVVEGLSSLNEILSNDEKKREQIAKGIALTQIAIDTAQAFSGLNAESAKASAQVAGVLGPATPIFTAAYYAQGVARILANVARAKQLLSGGSASKGGSQPQTTNIQGIQQSVPQVSSTLPQVSGFEQRVFVTEGDISRTQARVGNTKRVSVVK